MSSFLSAYFLLYHRITNDRFELWVCIFRRRKISDFHNQSPSPRKKAGRMAKQKGWVNLIPESWVRFSPDHPPKWSQNCMRFNTRPLTLKHFNLLNLQDGKSPCNPAICSAYLGLNDKVKTAAFNQKAGNNVWEINEALSTSKKFRVTIPASVKHSILGLKNTFEMTHAKLLFICLFSISVSSLVKVSVQIFVHFSFSWIACFLVLQL